MIVYLPAVTFCLIHTAARQTAVGVLHLPSGCVGGVVGRDSLYLLTAQDLSVYLLLANTTNSLEYNWK